MSKTIEETETDESSVMECANCGCEIDENDSMCAEVDGKSEDVCESCYYDLTNECQLCCERFDENDTSEFILCKAELSTTGRRPPGIYRIASKPFLSIPMIGSGSLHSNSVMFVDKLPEPDSTYEISGHICKECAKKRSFAKKFRKVYGKGQSFNCYDAKQWAVEREHTRKTILANPDMLRDLECDNISKGPNGERLMYADNTEWIELKELYDLPDLPTYHEWLFIEHKGVKVYRTSEYTGYYGIEYVGWLALSPEPRFRSGAGRLFPQTFSATSLPTHEPYDHDRQRYHERENALKAIVAAIDQGILRQDGCYDADGNPIICR